MTKPKWLMFRLHTPSAMLGVLAFIVVLITGARLTLALTPESLKPLVSSLAGIVVDEACSSKVSDARTECARGQQEALNKLSLEYSNLADELRGEVVGQQKKVSRLCQRIANIEALLCLSTVTNVSGCRNIPRGDDCE